MATTAVTKTRTKNLSVPIGIGVVGIIILIIYLTKDKWMGLLNASSASLGTDTSNGASSSTSGSTTGASSNTGAGSNSSTSPGIASYHTTLKRGDRGEAVKELQRELNQEHTNRTLYGIAPILDKLTVDGIFGAKTEELLERFVGKKTASVNYVKNYFANQWP